MIADGAARRAGRREWVGLAVLAATLLRHAHPGSEPEGPPASVREEALAESVGVEKAYEAAPVIHEDDKRDRQERAPQIAEYP